MHLLHQEKQQLKRVQVPSLYWGPDMTFRFKQWKDWSNEHKVPITKLSGFKSFLLVIISVLVAQGTSRKLWMLSLKGSNLFPMRRSLLLQVATMPSKMLALIWAGVWFVIVIPDWKKFLSLRKMLID